MLIASVVTGWAQDPNDVHFIEPIPPIHPDSVNVHFIEGDSTTTTMGLAEPVEGYEAFWKHLESLINGADTLGKKIRIDLYPIRMWIGRHGNIDSSYVTINHSAGGIHYYIAKEIIPYTKWVPLKKNGRPHATTHEVFGRIRVSKSVCEKYRYYPRMRTSK